MRRVIGTMFCNNVDGIPPDVKDQECDYMSTFVIHFRFLYYLYSDMSIVRRDGDFLKKYIRYFCFLNGYDAGALYSLLKCYRRRVDRLSLFYSDITTFTALKARVDIDAMMCRIMRYCEV